MDLPERVLRDTRVIAVVGCSRDPEKAAHRVPRHLQERGYRIIPVNPQLDELLGERCYSELERVPGAVDLVLVFRPSAEAPGIARTAAKVGARALWLQEGLRSAEARSIAAEAGMAFVEDRCAAVEAALHGINVAPALP